HVAVHRALDHHAEAVHVHQLGEALVLAVHLRIDAPRRLDAPYHARRQVLGGQPLRQRALDPAHRLAAVAQRGADAFADDAVAIRVQRAEAEVLQLGLDLVHAQALGDRRVDLQRLTRDAAARGRVLRTQ